jgi:hypothetical protein
LVAHSTHWDVVESQILAPAGQSAAVLQPTHWPVDVLQIGALPPPPPPPPGWQLALLVQAARHVWLAG